MTIEHDETTADEAAGLSISRRKVLVTSAWAAPTIAVATAAPAFAGSGPTPQAYSQDFATIGTGDFGSGALAGWGLYVKATGTSIGNSYLSNALGTTTNAGATTVTKAATPWNNTSGGFLNYASPKSPLTSASNATDQAAATDRALGLVQTGAPTADPQFDPGMSVVYDFSGQSGSLALKSDVTVSVTLSVVSPQTRSTTWTLQYGTSDTSWNLLDSFTTTATGTTFGEGKVLTGVVPNVETGSVKFRVVALTASTGGGSRDPITLDDFLISWLE